MRTLINNRYRIQKRLGRGGMGAVYLVKDRTQGNRSMALKMIRADLLEAHNLAQFKHEFAALRQLHHPNLVAVYDFDSLADSEGFFFTMEYVPGEDLPKLVRQRLAKAAPEAPKDYAWLYPVVVDVCRALQYLHSRGLIHYDVKPANIRVMPDGQAKLMDFGLIGEPRGEGKLRVRGTPEYIAPEIVRGDAVDHRADLYSLGVSLYEIVTGRLPFTGDSSIMILRQHVEEQPDPPRRFVQDIPEGLQALILKLMAKEPAQRYASADQVIHAINAISEGAAYPLETKATKHGYIQSGRLVGREFELTHLRGRLMRMLQGEGRLILIGGPTGVGKTRLLREIKLQAQIHGVLVCESVCHEQRRSPYHPWRSILNQAALHPRASAVYLSPGDAATLARFSPDLAEKFDLKVFPQNQENDPRSLHEAIKRFLMTPGRPLMLVLEDVHYADRETIELLAYLGERAPQGQVLLFGLYRDDEINDDHPLSTLIRQAVLIRQGGETPPIDSPSPEQPAAALFDLLSLHELDETQTAELIQSMLGINQDPQGLLPALMPRLMSETGGNALFIENVMRTLVDDDLLRYDGNSWQIDLPNLAHIPGIEQVAQRRLARLEADDVDLLQWAAAIGQIVDLDLLTRVSALPAETVFLTLTKAVQLNILNVYRRQDGHSTYRFSADPMRSALYDRLSPAERVQRHCRIAEALQQFYGEAAMPEQLAWHYERAGDLPNAFRYTRLAADKARQVYANESAIEYYTHALQLLAADATIADPQTEYELLSGCEECHRRVGNTSARQIDLQRMEQLAQHLGAPALQIDVINRQVNLAVVLGNHAEARKSAELGRVLARQVGDAKLEADSLAAIGEASYWLDDFAYCQVTSAQAYDLYRQLGDARGEAKSLRLLGVVARRQERLDQARTYFERSLALYRSVGDRLGEADLLNALGVIDANFAHKRSYYEQTLAIAEAVGDRYRLTRTYNNLGLLYFNLGLYRKAQEYLEKAISADRQSKGRSNLVYSLESLGRVYLELGNYEQAEALLKEGRQLARETGSPVNESLYWLALGRLALARDQPEQALHLLQTACSMHRDLETPTYLVTSLAWLSAAHLALDNPAAALQASSEAIALLEKIGTTGSFPAQDVWWAHYQVLRGQPAFAADGDPQLAAEAKRALQRAHDAMLSSIATLSDDSLRRNYLNRVRINHDILTEWARQTSLPPIEPEIAAHEAPPAAEELQQVRDKFKRVLDISLRMNETRDVNALLEYIMDQVVELSGAERGFVALFDRAGRMEFKVTRGLSRAELERHQAQLSYTIIGTVTQSGQPVLLQDALADEHFGRQSSVLDLQLRSVLCVPLVAHSELIGALYADNRSISGRFSQADVDLLTIFASQAAAAIENARLHEERQRINKELEKAAQNLEKRVNERTAELRQRTRQLQTVNVALTRRALQLKTTAQVANRITSILTLESLLPEVVHLIQAQFGYYFVGVWLLTDEEDAVVLRAGSMPKGASLPQARLSIEGSGIIPSVCRSGQYRYVAEVTETPDYVALAELPNTRSELALPLNMGKRTIGALDIHWDSPVTLEEDDRLVLQSLADQIAIAIRNAQLYQKEFQRRQFAEALERTGRELSGSLDIRELPRRILEQLLGVVPYERGAIWLAEGEALSLIAQVGFPPDERLSAIRMPIRKGDVYQQIVKKHRALLIGDVSQEPGWRQVTWLPLHRSWMGVPLISQNRVFGMISLTRLEANAFTAQDASRASAFASQAAIALENARLYEAITRFNEQLEQTVQERTEELNRAYRSLEWLDRAKSNFIDIAAHELRTPLTTIHGYSHLLLESPATEANSELRTLSQGIIKGANRLQEIINSMLDVAKIDNQTLQLSREWIKLAPLISQICRDFEAALAERHQVLDVVGVEGLPTLYADQSLLFKVFTHLVMNAIKYTPDGGKITISGSLVTAERGETEIEMVVSDTGIGIAKDQQEVIFEKFYQTGEVSFHSSGRTKFKGGGPGLGLAIARGIVLAHGGRIWVESDGHDEARCPGSRFYVRLPIGA